MKKYFTLLFLPLAATLLFSCSPPTATSECDRLYQERNGEVIYYGDKTNDLIIHLTSEPPNLHPTSRSHANRDIIVGNTHMALAVVGSEGELVPELAEAPPEVSADGLTYTYRIHPAAKWQDGRPITARDVLFSYKVAVYKHTEAPAAGTYNYFLKDIVLDEADERKLSLVMAEKYILNPYITSNNSVLDQAFFDPEKKLDAYTFTEMKEPEGAAAQDQALIEWAAGYTSAKYGTDLAFLKGGAGPYEVVEWEQGQHVVLQRKRPFWSDPLNDERYQYYPERMMFKFIPDDQSAALQIKQQAIDVSTQLSTAAFEDLQNSEEAQCHYRLIKTDRFSIAAILLNNRPDGIAHPRIFDDKRVRQAVGLALPVKEMIRTYFDSSTKVVNSPVSRFHRDYNTQLPDYEYDPQAAARLLDEAGWVDSDQDGIRDKLIEGKQQPLSFKLSFSNSQQAVSDMVDRIGIELKKIGVACVPDPQRGISGLLMEKNYDAVLTALSMSSVPYDFHQLWHSSNWPSASNFTGYSNPRVDELSELARRELDPEKRKLMVDEIQEIIYEDRPALFLFNPTAKIAIHKRFSNAEIFHERPYLNFSSLKVVKANSQ